MRLNTVALSHYILPLFIFGLVSDVSFAQQQRDTTPSAPLSSASMLDGTWVGTLDQEKIVNNLSSYSFEIDIHNNGNNVTGTSRIKTNNGYYGVMQFTGTFINGTLQYRETSIVEQKPSPNTYWCLKKGDLILSDSGTKLTGKWSDPGCNAGSVHLQKERHWSLKAGAKVSKLLEVHIDQISNAYYRTTSKNLVVTDGDRTAAEQAQAILRKLQTDGVAKVRALYKNKALIEEVITAFQTPANNANLLAAITDVIQSQINNENYISLHLTDRAFDVRSRDMNDTEKSAFVTAVNAAAGQLINETGAGEPHYHVQF
jgi:hypothetical protein